MLAHFRQARGRLGKIDFSERQKRPSIAGDSGRRLGKLDHSGSADRLADARRDSRTAVREHKRPKDRRTVPRDEHTKASIEKGLADDSTSVKSRRTRLEAFNARAIWSWTCCA